jgi:hypothetical protein
MASGTKQVSTIEILANRQIARRWRSIHTEGQNQDHHKAQHTYGNCNQTEFGCSTITSWPTQAGPSHWPKSLAQVELNETAFFFCSFFLKAPSSVRSEFRSGYWVALELCLAPR